MRQHSLGFCFWLTKFTLGITIKACDTLEDQPTVWPVPYACAQPYHLGIGSHILVPRGRVPFGQHQESRPLARSNTRSPRFTDFPSLCACSESSLTNLISSGLNLLCLQSHSKPECRWTRPEVAEVAFLGADRSLSLGAFIS